jgi:hypothetical protein
MTSFSIAQTARKTRLMARLYRADPAGQTGLLRGLFPRADFVLASASGRRVRGAPVRGRRLVQQVSTRARNTDKRMGEPRLARLLRFASAPSALRD